ncbi:LysR family transcriptional regulator [Paenibacillus baekrokdamisoli]|uniref:LysR family transcriptional regulator n=1 Tax=Paenibacillus baekrokdamisoli TaxID=1712516 RepID=A0A3G9IRV4_9BACL|nr:LysR family transcriptional regulator [Paenibacillus baekrokdamisoli]MBB3069335.1 DNA-binding transcriptional LysR family regulator [Paenibacillus baekrokdamisoli]BBH18695.1 LysR family transcriptional regulator [Paenibacillus baekrokdamisoli]
MVEYMEWYRVFYYTAKTGSLSKAAEALFITQPAVTHTIKQLEAKLGGQLFFRTSKGVRLTADGEALFPYIEQAYHFIENGERKIADMHQLLDGDLKIGAGDTLSRHYLLPYLSDFHKKYPAIKIQVTNRTTEETLMLLKQGRIDMGIVNLPIIDQEVVIQETLTIEDCFIVGEAYKELSDKPVSWAQLMSYPIIMLEKGSVTRSYVDRIAEQQGVAIKPEIELGSIDLLLEFARIGLGVACLVKNFITEELQRQEVYEVQLDKPIPQRRVGIATLKNVPLTAAADTFIQNMLKQ